MKYRRLVIACLMILAVCSGFTARNFVARVETESSVFGSESDITRQLSAYAPEENAPVDSGVRSNVNLGPLEVFYEALQHLRKDYVEPIDRSKEQQLAYGALTNMLNSLKDPLTRFLEPKEADVARDAMDGKFYGIGAIISAKTFTEDDISEEKLVISTVVSESPAALAGLRSGDTIKEIDGKPILPYNPFQRVEKLVQATRNGKISRDMFPKLLEEETKKIDNGVSFLTVMDMLSAKDGKEVALTIIRRGRISPLKVKINPSETVLTPVTHRKLESDVGYVKINLLNKEADAKFAQAIDDFKKQEVSGLVIDLRDSVGGSIESVQTLAGVLMPDRIISVLQLPRGRERSVKSSSTPAARTWTGRTVVIVNNGTYGVSEVLAAAMHDIGKSKLIGDRTAGKNVQQTFIQLSDGSAVTMATGKYLTPKGFDFENKGIPVDLPVTQAGAKPGADPQLAAAVKTLRSEGIKG